jgi:hypothetical protein
VISNDGELRELLRRRPGACYRALWLAEILPARRETLAAELDLSVNEFEWLRSVAVDAFRELGR